MGSDFGGVIALTPAVLWLMLALSGRQDHLAEAAGDRRLGRPRGRRDLGARLAARAPIGVRHLGNFVQRIIDGDALDVISRKAVASAETIICPLGIGSLLIGILLWIVIFRYACRESRPISPPCAARLIAALDRRRFWAPC